MDKCDQNFQKKLAYAQIYYSGIISIGCTFLAIGVALLILSLTVLDKLVTNNPSILNSDALNSLSQFFSITGLIMTVFGLTAPTIRWRSVKSEPQNRPDPNQCFCGNKIPCPIHENKSPI